MRNLTFKAAMLNDSRTTVNRQSTDGQSQRHYKQTPLSKRWRALMMVVFLFTLGIGQMWGTATNFHDFVAAGDTIIDIEGTSTPSTKMSTINGTDWAAVSTSAKNNSIYRMNPSTEEVATSKTNVYGTKLGSSAKSTYKVTGVSNVIFYVGTSSAGRTAYLDVTENGKSKVSEAASVTLSDKNNAYKMSYTLDASKSYTLEAYASSDIFCYAVKFTVASKCTKPGTPTSLAAGSVTHNSASLSWTAGANSDGFKIYIEKKSDKTKVLDWTDCATNSYAASGLSPETTYTFKVKAKGATGYCELGDEASADFATEVDPSATTYKVTLVPAGGTISDATGWTLNAGNYEKEVSEGTELTLPTFTKANRTFKTWRNAVPADVASPVTVDADLSLTAIWTATIEQGIYSWESPDGTPIEVGGTAKFYNGDTDVSSTAAPDNRVNYANKPINGDDVTQYYTLRLDKAVNYSAEHVRIALDNALAEGDKIKITAYYTKNQEKTVAPKIANASDEVVCSTDNLVNLYNGGTPVTQTKTLNDKAEGATTLKLTRSATSTTAFVSKLQIIREVQVEEANIRTVTFNYNDGGATANKVVEVVSGSKVSAEVAPSYAHHRFHEWQLGGVAYDFSTAVTSNITLTADWTQLYTVTYAKGEESATGDAPTQDELAAGEKFTVAANTFAYEGHDFSTWNDGSKDVAPASEYTMGAANVTLTAQWITATTKVTVTYKDGETTLGSEEITINTGSPVGYATYQTRNLATFDGWYNDPDLAEGHKIADISVLTASANVNVYGKWNYQYASSANIEQWTLDNGKGVSDAQKETQTGALMSLLGTRKYASNIAYDKGNIELDSLNDEPGKTNRNNAYLGLKVKKSGKMLDFRLAKDSYVKVKFGNVAATPKVSINGADYADMEITDGVYSYTATGNDYISIKTASDGAVVFKQIMINEPIADVTLPWRVTYDANGGTYADESVKYTGTPLVIGNATPADEYHEFAGWFDGDDQIDASGYVPTKNVTLQAHYSNKKYTVTYSGGEGATGSMDASEAEWGTLVVPAANEFEKTGYVHSGWLITKTSDGSDAEIAFSEGKFEMPKFDVTLVAQWEDNSSVVKVVRENYEQKYDNFLAARNDVRDNGGTIIVLQDITDMSYYGVNAAITIDLNGHRLATADGNNMFLVYDGGSLTINGAVEGSQVHGRINVGSNAGSDGTLILNGGTYTCAEGNTCIHVHGESDNSVVTINGATITSPNDNGVQFNGKGVYTVTDATISGGTGIYIKSGELTITNSTVTGNLSPVDYSYNGNGSNPTGAGIVVDACNYPGGAPTINIISGDFSGTKSAVGSYNYQGTSEPAIGGIEGGTFSSRVPNDLCAENFVPSEADPVTGKYTVEPKEGVCIIKGNVGNNTFVIDEVASLFEGTADKNNVRDNSSTYAEKTGWKFTARPARLGLTLSGDETFQAGDVVEVFVTSVANIESANDKMRIFDANEATAAHLLYESEADMVQGVNRIVLPATTTKSLYLHRTKDGAYDNFNPFVAYVAVYRPMMPKLTAITINGEACVKGEGNTFTITLPEEGTDFAALTVVPTVIRNAAHATTPEAVVSNEGAWQEGNNTYRVMDKDGDYTDYTITITLQGQAAAPVITTQPAADVAYCAGNEPTLTVEATGDELHYAWFKEAGETDEAVGTDAASYTIASAGTYYVVVINHIDGKLDASVTSANAVVTLNVAAAITTQPTNKRDVVAGSEVTLSVVATNATGYQWYSCDDAEKHGAAAISGAEAANYVFTCTANGFYYCVLGNACGEDITSNVVSVKLEPEGCNLVGTPSGNAYTQAGEWSIYPVNSSGQHDPEGTDFGTCKAFDEETDVNCVNTRRFAIKFEKDVESVTIYARGGTGRTFDKVSVADEMAKNAYTELTDITKQLVTIDGAGKEYIATAEGMIPGGKYAWFDFSGSFSGVFKICYTTALAMPKLPTLSDQELCAGAAYETFNATITNAAACEGTISYKWYSTNDTENPVAETAEFTPSTDGTYYVVVTHSAAGHITRTVQSDNLTVAHFDALTLVSNSGDVFQHMGTAATLSVVATGKNVAYVWYTCSNAAGDDAVAIDPAETEAELTIASILEGVHYYKVVISHDCDATTLSHIFKVEGWNQLEQVDVTASTVWDMTNVSASEINLASFDPSKQNVRLLLANIEGVNNNSSFNSQALMFEGQRIGRTENNVKYVSGQYVQFNVTVPGMVSVTFASNGSAQRTIQINGKVCSRTTNDGTYITYNVAVEPGSVEIEDVQGYVRISKIEFKAEDNYHRTVNPANIGTLCWTNNAVLGGATLYELAGKNEYNKLVFEEVDENRLEAGKPYVFVPENGNTVIKVYNTDSEEALSLPLNVGNGMMGTFVDMSSADGTTLYGNYVISNNKYIYVDSNNVTVRAYRAYITSLDDITPANPEPGQSQNGSPRRRMMIGGENAPAITTGIENTGFESEAPRKVLINGELYIIRGEKMYDAKGQLVK